uniref:Uncharacterized protein n=1 Tax=Anguilla anguilla TaxID=7936 RepID=A0A0E9W5V2_ANGAN
MLLSHCLNWSHCLVAVMNEEQTEFLGELVGPVTKFFEVSAFLPALA